MKLKKTLVLFITLVFLVLLAYLLERPKGTVQPSSLFPEFTIDAAGLIDVHNKGSKEEAVSLVKAGQDWKVAGEEGFPADAELVKKALESISELKKAANVVSKNPENQKLYEVDPNNGIEVKVSDGKKKVLADFFVGKTGPDFMSTYLRKADSNVVLLCEGYHLRSAFSRTVKNWYDLNVSKFTPEEIAKIEIAGADGKKLTLKKDTDKWQLIDPNQQQAQAQKNLADDMANTLSRLRSIDLLKAEPDKFAEYNLVPPARQVAVFLTDGTERKISVGKKNEQNQYYVRAEKDVVYLVAQYHIDKLGKSFEELKEVPPPPAQADPEGVQPGANAFPSGENPADSASKSQAGTPQGTPAPKMPPAMPMMPPASPKSEAR